MSAAALAPALISGGSQVIGAVTGAIGNKAANNAAYHNSKKLFDYQNAYNTPLKQRERLVAAGLNPALMYQGGSISNTGGSISNPPVRSEDAGQGVGSAVAGAVEAYMRYTMMDKELQVMEATRAQKAQSVVSAQWNDKLSEFKLDNLLPSQYKSTLVSTERNAFGLEKDKAFLAGSLQAQKLSNEKTEAEIQNVFARTYGAKLDNFAKEITNSNLSESEKLRIDKMRVDLANASLDAILKDEVGRSKAVDTQLREIELQLSKLGMNSQSGRFLQLLLSIFKK